MATTLVGFLAVVLFVGLPRCDRWSLQPRPLFSCEFWWTLKPTKIQNDSDNFGPTIFQAVKLVGSGHLWPWQQTQIQIGGQTGPGSKQLKVEKFYGSTHLASLTMGMVFGTPQSFSRMCKSPGNREGMRGVCVVNHLFEDEPENVPLNEELGWAGLFFGKPWCFSQEKDGYLVCYYHKYVKYALPTGSQVSSAISDSKSSQIFHLRRSPGYLVSRLWTGRRRFPNPLVVLCILTYSHCCVQTIGLML